MTASTQTRPDASLYPPLPMKRWIFAIAGLLLVGILAFRLWQEIPASAAAPAGGMGRGMPGTFARAVGAAPAELGEISEVVTLVGALRALQTVNVTPRVNGRVVEMLVDIGDRVRAGQTIARLDDDELQQQMQQSNASLEVARAVVQQRELELKNLDAILQRTRGLRESGLISDEQLDQAQTRYDVGQAQLNLASAQLLQAEASTRELQIRLEQTDIQSPISGWVGRRFVDVGALLNSSTPVATVIDLDAVKLVANVSERDLVKLQPGAVGDVYVDALPGEVFTGTVERVSPLLDSQTRTAEAEILVPNEHGHLRAEMFARVDLELANKRDALRVPREAVVVRGTEQGVYVIVDNVAMFREVGLGLSEADWIEVTSGLTEGEMVVTQGSNLLKDGDHIRVAGEERPPGGTSS